MVCDKELDSAYSYIFTRFTELLQISVEVVQSNDKIL
jgi:hypothetical protein